MWSLICLWVCVLGCEVSPLILCVLTWDLWYFVAISEISDFWFIRWYTYQDERSLICLGVCFQVWCLKLIVGVFHVAGGLWPFCRSVSRIRNSLKDLWVFSDLKVLFLEYEVSYLLWMCVAGLEISDLLMGVRSFICLWVHFSDEVSVLFLPFYPRIWVSDLFVCQGCAVSSVCGYMSQFVRSLPVRGYMTQNMCLPPFLDICPRVGDPWSLWTCMTQDMRSLACLWVYISGWYVLNCLWMCIWCWWRKFPQICPYPNLWNMWRCDLTC